MTPPLPEQEKKMVDLAVARAEHFWGERSDLELEEQNAFDNEVETFKAGESSRLKEIIKWFNDQDDFANAIELKKRFGV